jgi:hypothetical protein
MHCTKVAWSLVVVVDSIYLFWWMEVVEVEVAVRVHAASRTSIHLNTLIPWTTTI